VERKIKAAVKQKSDIGRIRMVARKRGLRTQRDDEKNETKLMQVVDVGAEGFVVLYIYIYGGENF